MFSDLVRTVVLSPFPSDLAGSNGPGRVSGEDLVPEPPVQDEAGPTREGHARGPSCGGHCQRAIVAQTGSRTGTGAGRQAVHQSAAGLGRRWRRRRWRWCRWRRQGRTNGIAVVLASANARSDAKDVVVTAVVV